MARKIPGLQRVLDAPALFSVAYGEIASSIYLALGIIALHALGLTPVILALVGALFLVVSLSYAEGTTAIPETGGAATFVRRAFNDLAGFLTGWALFLDYLIVIALSRIMPRKTWRGVQALDRVKGFREFLERTSKDELRRLPPDTMHKWLAWAIALGVSERWIHAFDGLPVSQPSWYVSRGGFDLDGFDRSLSRFFSATEQALLTSRRGAGDSWSGSGGLSGGSSGGGMGGGGGGTF